MSMPRVAPVPVQARLLVAALTISAVTSVAGCSAGTDTPRDGTPGAGATTSAARSERGDKTPASLPQDEGGPLLGLPECDQAPEAITADVAGLLLPDGAIVTAVDEAGPLVNVQAYVAQTPIAVRQFYQQRPGLELFEIEDEIFEAEVLYGEGAHRSYVKAQATCQQGSRMLVTVGPAGTDAVPEVGAG